MKTVSSDQKSQMCWQSNKPGAGGTNNLVSQGQITRAGRSVPTAFYALALGAADKQVLILYAQAGKYFFLLNMVPVQQ
jgi:hypothetical protein